MPSEVESLIVALRQVMSSMPQRVCKGLAKLSLTEPLIRLSDRPNWFGEGQSF